MKRSSPIDSQLVDAVIQEHGLSNVGACSIREIRRLIDDIEQRCGTRFLRMEMGIPGLPPPAAGARAEAEAHSKGCASLYPPVAGLPELKQEIARFVRLFLNTEVSPVGCLPTVGSLQGSFVTFMVASGILRSNSAQPRDTVLFIDPGFPVHKAQARMLGLHVRSFDIAEHRGEALRARLEAELADGRVACVLYSNPNNPTWICLSEAELSVIAECAERGGALVVEDLAYIAMDFRSPFGRPGTPPYPPTVSKFSNRYVLLISSSKAFSYAGQRVGMLVVSDALYRSRYPELQARFGQDSFGAALLLGALYGSTAGTAHSAQHGLAAILRATNNGEYNFIQVTREYERRAAAMKRAFLAAGFELVYAEDGEGPIGDGFYFTVGFPGLSGEELVAELLYYGLSAIALGSTGAARTDGIRACVSLLEMSDLAELTRRLEAFAGDRHSAAKAGLRKGTKRT